MSSDVGDERKVFTFHAVASHNNLKDCWLIIEGKVYDVTPFLDDHPGGDDILLLAAGKDVTNDFEDVGHSTSAREMLDEFYVGEIDGSSIQATTKYKSRNKMSSDMGDERKVLTFSEVASHNNSNDCSLIIENKVYDVTSFLDEHPGGDEVLLSATGKDATDDFEDVGHSTSARGTLDVYNVGEIDVSIPAKTCNNRDQPEYYQDKRPEFMLRILRF